jgi:DNA uptake protein ComE-like DNA-binding protein
MGAWWHCLTGKKAKSGFALPTVLTVVTILTLIFMTCILALHDLFDQTQAALAASEFERAAASAEARFAYLAATEPLGPTSLRIGADREPVGIDRPVNALASANHNPILDLKLDGRPYSWSETPGDGRTYQISIQDEAGLVNVDFEPSATLLRLFSHYGADQNLTARLTDELADYIDEDDLARLNGAEADAYRAAGLPVPPNRKLRRPTEISGLLSWRKLSTMQRREISQVVTAQPDLNSININTAPADALEIMFGVSRAQADQAIADRERAPLSGPLQLGATSFDDERVYVFPNGRLRFRFIDPKNGFLYRSEISLTPGHQDRPVWIQDQLSQHTDQNGLVGNTQLLAFPQISQAPDR